MLSIFAGDSERHSQRISRRELLRAGGLSLLGLSSIDLERLRAAGAADRRANACIFIFLFGGPSHIDLWDMKPDSPAEIRGEFKPTDTNVPGIRICEHLPLLADQMDKLCLLRSMEHRMPVHGPACSEMLTGRPYFGPPVTDQARPEDWPSLSSLAMRYTQQRTGLPPAVILPWYLQFAGQDKRIAGQTSGRMGDRHNPFLVKGDPSDKCFQVQGIGLADDMPPDRVAARRELLNQLGGSFTEPWIVEPCVERFSEHVDTAFSLLGDVRAINAFALQSEPSRVRERYGETKFGQSLLLARRLVESGVSLITVNWDDDTRNDKVSPFWDTHNHNFAALKGRLAPSFDRSFSALLADLADRGLLETTLLVVTGEFGRTPKIGQVVQNGMTEKTGRDHWPHAFTVLLAGGGVRGGQVYGATNKIGGYVQDRPVSPADLSATILHHLGVDFGQSFYDEFQQVHQQLSIGRVIAGLG